MKVVKSDLDIKHPHARRAVSDSSLQSYSGSCRAWSLGASISPFVLVDEEHSNTVWLVPNCVEHQSPIPCIPLTLLSSIKLYKVGGKVSLRQDDRPCLGMDAHGLEISSPRSSGRSKSNAMTESGSTWSLGMGPRSQNLSSCPCVSKDTDMHKAYLSL